MAKQFGYNSYQQQISSVLQQQNQHQENSVDKNGKGIEKAWQTCNYCQNLVFKSSLDFIK